MASSCNNSNGTHRPALLHDCLQLLVCRVETTTVSTMALAPVALTVSVWPTTLGSTASTETVSCSVGSLFAVQVHQALLLFLHPKVTHLARMVPVTMATAPVTMATPESVVTRVRHYSYYYGGNGRGRAGRGCNEM